MTIGYIVNGTHPLLKTINLNQVSAFKGTLPILIVGIDLALQYNSTTSLASKKIEEGIYYSFSKEESEEKYTENLNNFVINCLKPIVEKYSFQFITDVKQIKFTSTVFFYSNNVGEYIVTEDHIIYYYNKQFNAYFEKENVVIPSTTKIIQWKDSFSALLKCNRCYIAESQYFNIVKPYCDTSKFFPAVCFEWAKELKEESSYETWLRAFKIENNLSQTLIRVDVKLLQEKSDEVNAYASMLENVEGDYIIQHYNGTDKTTGRLFPIGDGFSVQTLQQHLRNVIIAEKDSYLIEFDYDYFEYTILAQLLEFEIGEDPHTSLAELLFKDKSKRPLAKIINYGLIYGRSIITIVDELKKEHGLTQSSGELIQLLEPITKKVQKLSKQLQKQFDQKGYIVNFFGREIVPQKKNAYLNNYIQSTAVDYVLIKLEKLIDYLEATNNPLNKLVLQNHDSILVNLSIKDIEKTNIASEIKNILEAKEYGNGSNRVNINGNNGPAKKNGNGLSAKVDIKFGKNWSFNA